MSRWDIAAVEAAGGQDGCDVRERDGGLFAACVRFGVPMSGWDVASVEPLSAGLGLVRSAVRVMGLLVHTLGDR